MKKQSAPVSEIEEAHEALVVEHAALLEKYAALKERYAQVAPPAAPAMYAYADGACRPVYPEGTCSVCGWTRDGKNPDPHPIA